MPLHTLPRAIHRPSARLILALAAALILAGLDSMRPFLRAQTGPIVAENSFPGNPASEWDVSGAGDPSIQGFATDISVNKGQTVSFKVKTDSTIYAIDIYRLGYYDGAGARLVATVLPSTSLPQTQPACEAETVDPVTGLTPAGILPTGLVDCGNWSVSASWSTADAVSGIYVARLKRLDTGGASHIVFIVRDDARKADVIVQASDTTWQAYNQYGGGSMYCGGPVTNASTVYSCVGRATRVSYNRPFDTRAHDPQSFVFNAEYPMVRWLEANGYDVKYISGVDTERRAGDLVGAQKPKAFFSVGHDEYWSAGQRASVEAARNAGVSLAFFSGNEMYWKTRFESSVDGAGTPFRTLVSYKETLGGVKLDPMPGVSTATWRDARFGPPAADGGRPENGLTGTIWTVNSGTSAIAVPASMANLRFWRNTRVATLTTGSATLGTNTLGYEWDEDLDNGARPNGLIHLSSTTVDGVEKILDFGETVGVGTATHSLTLYRHDSGALVFGAGTVQWSWGLDGNHDRGAGAPDQAMQQATVNLLADMGAQPGSLQIGADPTRPLVAATQSSDPFAPTSIITSPAAGGTVGNGDRVTISGTASDSGGVVAGVEVSVDGGVSWHAATGGASWTYDWIPGAIGQVTITTRATDDSGNRETSGAGIVVSVVAGRCPCPSLWTSTTVPPAPEVDDSSALELGLKFRSDVDGFLKGVRFYKSVNNNGTHVGSLWTSTGTRLATATFASETPSGWQEVLFDVPVAVAANTTYVVSYHTNVGHYAAASGYFSSLGVDASPLHAPPSGAVGGNGLYQYGPTAFPTQTFNATNYWVDVVFDRAGDTTAPLIADVVATPVDSSVAIVSWTTNEASTSRVDYSTSSTFPAAETLTVSDPAFVTAHIVRLTGLHPSTAYFFRVRSADRAGNESSKPSLGPAPAPVPGGPTPPPPQGFTMPGPTLRDTTRADFSTGTLTGTYAAETGDGEITLTPATGTEFSGTTMPSGWATRIWSDGGGATVAGGRLTVDGARVAACVDVSGVCQEQFNLAAGTSLEFVATFTGDPYQHSGFGQTLESSAEPFALFSTLSGGSLSVRSYTGDLATLETATNLGTTFLNAPHRFRIDWQASQVVYSVDGVQVASHPVAIAGLMRPVAASDYNAFSGNIIVDWIRTMPYAASGTFLSRVFDAGVNVAWTGVQWTSTIPAGSSLSITVCASQTLTSNGSLADPACSAALTASPQSLSALSRYVQYRADLTTTDPANATPELSDITMTGSLAPKPAPVTPVITWATPAAITYGTPLSDAQLNATTNVPSTAGTLVYAPASGTVLAAGEHTLSVTFTPDDTTRFTTVTASVAITVERATPTIAWSAPASITYGTALSATQLNATASVPGALVYTPAAATVLSAGVAQPLSVTFTPNDSVNYTTATASVAITVMQKTPAIAWSAPATIIAGTALSAAQLNATASVAGSFAYTPGAGTVLPAGPAQPLSVTFTPTDANYTTAAATVPITVLAIISASDLSITEGNATGATKQAWVTVKLLQKSTAWVSVNYTTSDGTAKADLDYFKVSDTAFFAPGVVTQQVAIPIVQDTVGEPTETFYVDFSGVVNGILGQSRATITIINDDSSTQVFSSVADFAAGTLSGSAYLSETGDGEIMLAPQGAEFSGTSLPAGWTNTPLATGSASTVANGKLVIDGASLLAPAPSASGQTLEFVATFNALSNQSIGLGTSSAAGSPMAMFVIRSKDLYAHTVNGARTEDTLMAGIDWLGKSHRYQINWNAGSAQYFVDGTLMITHGNMAWGAATMRPVIVDSTAGDGALVVDWIRMTPYAGSGTYTSAVFDAGDAVAWQKLTTTSTIPSGTTSTITYRTGGTPTPDGTWTPLTAPGAGGALAGSSRYVQFTIQIATASGARSPVIQDVTVQYKRY